VRARASLPASVSVSSASETSGLSLVSLLACLQRAETRDIVPEDVVELVPACSVVEYAVAGDLHAAPNQLIIMGMFRAERRWAMPTVGVASVLRKLKSLWYPTSELSDRREQLVLAELVRAIQGVCKAREPGERHRATIYLDAATLACVNAFVRLPGQWRKDMFEVELLSHKDLGYRGDLHWQFFSIISTRAVKRGMYKDGAECAEIVSRATTVPKKDGSCPSPLVLFTDFKRMLGIRFGRRIWADRGATLLGGPGIPVATHLWDPRTSDKRGALP